jgi:hypothetical protein
VASDIVKSYQLCLQGDFHHIARLEEIYQTLKRRPPVIATKEEVQEVDEEVEVDDDEKEEGEAMQIEKPEKAVPIVDEDGFQRVQGRGRRR